MCGFDTNRLSKAGSSFGSGSTVRQADRIWASAKTCQNLYWSLPLENSTYNIYRFPYRYRSVTNFVSPSLTSEQRSSLSQNINYNHKKQVKQHDDYNPMLSIHSLHQSIWVKASTGCIQNVREFLEDTVRHNYKWCIWVPAQTATSRFVGNENKATDTNAIETRMLSQKYKESYEPAESGRNGMHQRVARMRTRSEKSISLCLKTFRCS